ncbi:hypothetical protein HYX00_04865 [Candidatus Woesearchaeota archaeon]|nr:hypothetical protein [Candidatus Woesearchaeota archaeon]
MVRKIMSSVKEDLLRINGFIEELIRRLNESLSKPSTQELISSVFSASERARGITERLEESTQDMKRELKKLETLWEKLKSIKDMTEELKGRDNPISDTTFEEALAQLTFMVKDLLECFKNFIKTSKVIRRVYRRDLGMLDKDYTNAANAIRETGSEEEKQKLIDLIRTAIERLKNLKERYGITSNI